MDAEAPSGAIFDIQRFCLSDGPGIRTTVFLQGCRLRCPWCHNPESRPSGPRIFFRREKCIGCGRCARPVGGGRCVRHPEKACSGCGVCVAECPGGALSLLGRKVSVGEIMAIARRDAFYYGRTEGGLTLSGGEPLLQPDFAAALLRAARAEGFGTAVETSGAVPRAALEAVQPLCGLFLFDVKCVWERYEALIGTEPSLVRDNLAFLSDAGAAIRLRVPLVAGWNDDEAFLERLEELSRLPGVEGVDIEPYHNLGWGKAHAAGLPEPDWASFATPVPSVLERWRGCVRDATSPRSGPTSRR